MMVYEGKSTYILPQSFIDQMTTLEKMLVIPSKPDVKYSKTFVDTKSYKQNIVDKKTDRNWVKEKTNIIPFKITVMEIKEGLEKDINDIRKAMNMISKKNFDTQKEIIIAFVKGIIDDKESLVKISTFIFDIASSNMFYGDIYADLYVDFIVESSLFKDVLQDTLYLFKETINNIKSVDSNDDYDGYCKYIKENDKRRSLASFFMLLANRNVIDIKNIIDLIVFFQETLQNLIDVDSMNVECEEITELLYILITIGKTNQNLKDDVSWNKIIIGVSIISKSKASSHTSLSSRIVFKHLDIMDFMMT
jgi:hypothetical protein